MNSGSCPGFIRIVTGIRRFSENNLPIEEDLNVKLLVQGIFHINKAQALSKKLLFDYHCVHIKRGPRMVKEHREMGRTHKSFSKRQWRFLYDGNSPYEVYIR